MALVDSLYGIGQARHSRLPRRVATLSVHTSPLDQPGTGDAGGMNVYIVEVAERLAAAGVEVEIFTRATRGDLPPTVELAPGVSVRHITAGPYEGLSKEELPAQLCAFTNGVLRAEASRAPGWYDVIHSHYWLSGQVGWLAKDRWGVPLVHTAHTLAKVKNRMLAVGDTPEPKARVIGEEQVVAEADRLVASTPTEARELANLYGAPTEKLTVVTPGVDLARFAPPAPGREAAERLAARRRLGLPTDDHIVAFVGRIQPLKAPDVLLRAAAALRGSTPSGTPSGMPSSATSGTTVLNNAFSNSPFGAGTTSGRDRRLIVAVCGGPSGTGLERPTALMELAAELGISEFVRFLPPQPRDRLADVYRAADLVAVPSHNESFGLVALEAQACGTPVVAAAVGGLVTAVRDGISGVLVDSHRPADWARVIEDLLHSPGRRDVLSRGAIAHARNFTWNHTAAGLLQVYREAVTQHWQRRVAALAVSS